MSIINKPIKHLLDLPVLASDFSNLAEWTALAAAARAKYGLPSLETANGAYARYIAANYGVEALPDHCLPEYHFIRVLMAETPEKRKQARNIGLTIFARTLAYEAEQREANAFQEAAEAEAIALAKDEEAEAANAA